MHTTTSIRPGTGLLVGGTLGCAVPGGPDFEARAEAAGSKHACKGLNECSGKGGCGTDANKCAGQNTCKEQGGCSTVSNGCSGKNECKNLGGCANKEKGNSCYAANECKGQGGCKVPNKKYMKKVA